MSEMEYASESPDPEQWAKENTRPFATPGRPIPYVVNMELRDYFAAQIMGHVSASFGAYWSPGVGVGYVQRAYELADLMLKERAK